MTHIVGLRQLADFIEKSPYFDQGDGACCTIGHAFQLTGYADPTLRAYTDKIGDPFAVDIFGLGAEVTGLSREEVATIWHGFYPNRPHTMAERDPRMKQVAIDHLRALADKYEPIPAPQEAPQEARPLPLAVPVRELVPA